MTIVRIKVFAGLLLALLVGSCPNLMPLAAAAQKGQDHSCCDPSRNTSQDKQQPAGKEFSCCPASALPTTVSVPSFDAQVIIAVLSQGMPVVLAGKDIPLAFSSPSPPGDPPLRSSSPRAPPVVA